MLNSYKRGILDGVIVVKIGIYIHFAELYKGKGGCVHSFESVAFCLPHLY